jgi:hypothetical protein
MIRAVCHLRRYYKLGPNAWQRLVGPNNAMHTDSAITFRFESAVTGAEPVMANRSATQVNRGRFGTL